MFLKSGNMARATNAQCANCQSFQDLEVTLHYGTGLFEITLLLVQVCVRFSLQSSQYESPLTQELLHS